ncbi:MAG: PglZ domain-containing protein [Burkholderiaceae bacterium]
MESAPLQRDFAKRHVQPFLERKAKVCVLISDAFRYEVGEELQSLIRQEDKYEASLEPMLSMLPSYTHGMAAAAAAEHAPCTGRRRQRDALVDGQSAQGVDQPAQDTGRCGIGLTHGGAGQGRAGHGREDSRALVRDHDVVYVHHNLIDKTGDTRDTEERVFAAAQETLEELIRRSRSCSTPMPAICC